MERTRRTIAQSLDEATTFLCQNGFDTEDARRAARLLLSEILKRNRAFLIAHSDDEIANEDWQTFQSHVARRARSEPLQYLIGHQEFYGLDFEVTPDVLIPRPETELLVDIALELAREGEMKPSEDEAKQRPLQICDVGTGSGCIAIAVLHELAAREIEARAVALEISPAALRVAARNAARHNLTRERLAFIASDSFNALDSARAKFDLILSNPPYVALHELETLQREVREYEPRAALTPNPEGGEANDDGLTIIRRLLADAPAFLNPRGFLAFEIGFSQKAKVENLIDPRAWQLREVRADLRGIPRAFLLQRA